MSDLRYPIGPFVNRTELTPDERGTMIDEIAATPARMRDAVRGLSEGQLDTPYREGGWSVRQVVHHVPESHLNAYMRLKLALTESDPLVRPYDEDAWSRTAEVALTPIETSLTMLDALHERWTLLWRALTPEDFRRTFRHPEHAGVQTVDWLVAMYSWHGRHHVAHITALRARLQWPSAG